MSRLAAALATFGLGALVALLGSPALLEAWLLGFVLVAGISAGALGMLMLGHLLHSKGLPAVRPTLEALAGAVPVAALLALPVLLGVEHLYPWAGDGAGWLAVPPWREAWFQPGLFRLRTLLALALWAVLAWWMARPGIHPWRAAIGLILLVPSSALAAQDWVMSRDPTWYGSLQGVAFIVQQGAAAMALALLLMVARRGLPEEERARGLERTLLTLAVATLWLWFVQFVVAYAADLPEEAHWYLRRMDGWGWFKLGFVVPALVLAIVFGGPPEWRPWRVAVVSALVLAAQVGHMLWLLRPDAPGIPPPPWLDALVLPVIGVAWTMWWLPALRRARLAGRLRPA
ncbi:hypothetical protein [Crenalkalicoccus roseus]|uniref:hypothetical protein n=1 Tax=Crenalkalicoccus roseus TaxID=1485588 RepID=UPI001080E263|nr:hypothetical protein [Crenalkalicoccus roseus]